MASSPAESPPSPSEQPPPAVTSPPPSIPPPADIPTPPTVPPPVISPPPPIDISPPPPIDISPPPIDISPPPPSAPPPLLPPVPALFPPPPTISPPPPTPDAPPPSPAPPIDAPPPPSTPPPPSNMPPTSSPPPPPAPPLPSPGPPPPSAPPGESPPAPPIAPAPSNSSSGNYPSAPVPVSSPVLNETKPSPEITAPPPNPDNGLSSGATAGIVLTVLVVLSFLGLAVWCVKKRRKPIGRYESGFIMPSNHSSPISSVIMSDSSFPKSPSAPLVYHSHSHSHQRSGSVASESGFSGNKSWFAYDELYNITNGFSPQNILGEGGFGCVFKGVLSDGREVAVKQLKLGSGQGEREFKAEVEIISRIHHRHLVSLVGYCVSESHRLLVYDFVANGTLESHFHGKGSPPLTWPTRVRIAAGSARGLAYLHEDCHPRIIHRDIKSSNILIDNNFEAQVADFGLARLAMDTHTHVTTRVMGTFGYLAPEYASSGKLTEKSDVFSFGVVLLEIITGRKPVDGTRPLGDESLVEWARPMLNHAIETGEFGDLPDPKLDGNYDQTEMFRMIEVAAACVRHSASMRPKMSKVVRVLDSLADTDLDNGIKHGQSEMFNVAKTADIRLLQRLAFGTQEFSSSEFSQSNWSRQSDM